MYWTGEGTHKRTMARLCAGDRVKIKSGDYKGRLGVYIRGTKTGLNMGYVAIDGDTKTERRLWLSSLQKQVMEESDRRDNKTAPESTTTKSKQLETVTISKAEYDRLVNEVNVLENGVKGLKITLEKMTS